ncbi:hypothetical protein RRG08_017200 [Elysia crispata]|uniref:Uncharacterized protein n=1 Tax=Elysia crispata TaxID=231223 RepID=A0AAE0XV97_9GAST|nr:hypothetical protein RRG08_017200 [Elysia crispata]
MRNNTSKLNRTSDLDHLGKVGQDRDQWLAPTVSDKTQTRPDGISRDPDNERSVGEDEITAPEILILSLKCRRARESASPGGDNGPWTGRFVTGSDESRLSCPGLCDLALGSSMGNQKRR